MGHRDVAKRPPGRREADRDDLASAADWDDERLPAPTPPTEKMSTSDLASQVGRTYLPRTLSGGGSMGSVPGLSEATLPGFAERVRRIEERSQLSSGEIFALWKAGERGVHPQTRQWFAREYGPDADPLELSALLGLTFTAAVADVDQWPFDPDLETALQQLAAWAARRHAAQGALPASDRSFAAILARQRTAAGLTQVQLAERAGVTQSHISKLERGTWEPRLSTIMGLARALGVHPCDLLPPPGEPERE